MPPKRDEREEVPFFSRLVNHFLTPGSALTSGVWTLFNSIIFVLGLVWLIFVVSMPDNIHVWIFGGLFLGLALSTNWFFSQVFEAKLDYDSQQKGDTEAERSGPATAADSPKRRRAAKEE